VNLGEVILAAGYVAYIVGVIVVCVGMHRLSKEMRGK
jgi:hypothetical protein